MNVMSTVRQFVSDVAASYAPAVANEVVAAAPPQVPFRIIEHGSSNVMPGLRTVTTQLDNGVATVTSAVEHSISRPSSGMFHPGVPGSRPADITGSRTSPIRKGLEETPLHDAVAAVDTLVKELDVRSIQFYEGIPNLVFRIQGSAGGSRNVVDSGLPEDRVAALEVASRALLRYLDGVS